MIPANTTILRSTCINSLYPLKIFLTILQLLLTIFFEMLTKPGLKDLGVLVTVFHKLLLILQSHFCLLKKPSQRSLGMALFSLFLAFGPVEFGILGLPSLALVTLSLPVFLLAVFTCFTFFSLKHVYRMFSLIGPVTFFGSFFPQTMLQLVLACR